MKNQNPDIWTDIGKYRKKWLTNILVNFKQNFILLVTFVAELFIL